MMDYKTMYPWAPSSLLEETSEFTTREKIVLYTKSEHPKKKCLFGREDDRFVRVVPCRVDELVCCDEASDPDGPFYFFYSTIFKKLLLRLPLYSFEIALLTEINIASANYTQIARRLFGDFPSYATTLAICHQWKCSYTFLKPNDQVANCG